MSSAEHRLLKRTLRRATACRRSLEVVMQNLSMGSILKRWMPFIGILGLVVLGLTLGNSAFAADTDPYGGDVQYREMFSAEGTFGFLNPRVIVWILAQLHLLFAAFVLAIPMLVVGLECWGHFGIKDPVEKKRWDALAYEFARLMSTAFSITLAGWESSPSTMTEYLFSSTS